MKKEKKFRVSFKMGLLIYAAVVLALIFAGLAFFWNFIGDYEDGQPIHTMEEIIKDFENADVAELLKLSDGYEANSFEMTEDEEDAFLAENYNKYLNGKEITFVKSKDYTDKNPVYVVKADGQSVADVILESSKRNDSNFKMWELSALEIGEYTSKIITTSSIKIQVPEGTVVTVNGKEAGEEYKTGEEDIPELKEVASYMENAPKMFTYEISGFTKEPVVSAVFNGDELTLSKVDDTYTGTFTTSEEFVSEMSEYADKVAVAYAKNFINVEKKILPYVMKEADLYASIKSATTAFYPNSKISSYEFTEKVIDNFQEYGDDCFSCDVKYVLKIYFKAGYYIKDTTEEGDFKFFFVKKDGEWYLTSLTYNYE